MAAAASPIALSGRGRVAATYAVLIALFLAVIALAMLLGSGDLSDPLLRGVYLELRATRLAAAMLAGASLAVGGAVVQGLFRNPLASPSILGTTAGATFGGQAVLLLHRALIGAGVLGSVAPEMVLPLGCLLGAFASLGLLLLFVRRGGDIVTLLLSGFVLTSLFLAAGSFLTSLAQEHHELGRAIVAFTLGGVSGAGWAHVRLALPLVLGGSIAALLWGRSLDVLLSGEDEAASLGVDVTLARRWAIAWVAVLTAAAVAIGGNISFVGLVVPHALRPFVGAEHRRLIPACFLAGAVFLGACDVLARVIPSTTEIPLGVITGLIGAPLFLFLLQRSRREAELG
jgi:iron complex transport system permease protein